MSDAPYGLRVDSTNQARPDALSRWLLQTPASEVVAHLSGTGHLVAGRTGRRGPPGQFRNPDLSFEVGIRVATLDAALTGQLIACNLLQAVTAERIQQKNGGTGWVASTWDRALSTLRHTADQDRAVIPSRRVRTPARDASDAWEAIAAMCEAYPDAVPRDEIIAVLASWPRPVGPSKDASGAEHRPASNPTDGTVALLRVWMGTATPEDVQTAQSQWSRLALRRQAVLALPWQTPATRAACLEAAFGAPDAEPASGAESPRPRPMRLPRLTYDGRAARPAVLEALALEPVDAPAAPEWQPFLDDVVTYHVVVPSTSDTFIARSVFASGIARLGAYLSAAQWTRVLDAVTASHLAPLGTIFPLLAVGAARGHVTAGHCEAWLATKVHADDRATAIRLLGTVQGHTDPGDPTLAPPTSRPRRPRTP